MTAVIKHPYYDMDTAKALAIAQNILERPPSLQEAFAVLLRVYQDTPHVWITGAAALDVLEASITNTEVNPKTCRAN